MSLLLTSLLISLIAALCVWMMGRKDPCGRPWLTALCLGILLVLPLLSLLPKVQVDILQTSHTAALKTQAWGLGEALAALWSFVVIVLTLRLVWSQYKLKQWLKDAEKSSDEGWYQLMQECSRMLGLKKLPKLHVKAGLTSPVVTGLFRPVIIIPSVAEQWNEETRKMALLHELGHIQRHDLWVRLAAEFACVLHWYNPLVWWLRAKLLTQCEYACDALVVSAGADRKSYIHALCDVVESSLSEARPQGLMAMADHAPLKLRVNRLLGGGKAGKPWLAIIAAVATTTTALGLSLVRPVQVAKVIGGDKVEYTQEEIDLRHSANPFPAED